MASRPVSVVLGARVVIEAVCALSQMFLIDGQCGQTVLVVKDGNRPKNFGHVLYDFEFTGRTELPGAFLTFPQAKFNSIHTTANLKQKFLIDEKNLWPRVLKPLPMPFNAGMTLTWAQLLPNTCVSLD